MKIIIITILISLYFVQSAFSNTHNFSSDTILTINTDQNFDSITTNNNNEGIIDFVGETH